MILIVWVAAFLMTAVAFGAESVTALDGTVQAATSDCRNLTITELPMPAGEGEKNYLGLSGSGKFKIGQIKSQILIIEVFSFYCSHCQRMAAQVNDLYQEIQRRSDLNGKVKLIGIGVKNSAFEVDSFREKYQVPFPLFPDKDMEMTEKLCVKATPTFIGFKLDGKSAPERLFFNEGGFKDNQKFLSEIVQSAGLK